MDIITYFSKSDTGQAVVSFFNMVNDIIKTIEFFYNNLPNITSVVVVGWILLMFITINSIYSFIKSNSDHKNLRDKATRYNKEQKISMS